MQSVKRDIKANCMKQQLLFAITGTYIGVYLHSGLMKLLLM